MKKWFALALLVLAVSSLSFAQSKMGVGGDVMICMPTGTAKDALNMGFGFVPRFDYFLMENACVSGGIGFLTWGAKDVVGYKLSYTDIPIRVGGKYFFPAGGVKPYVEAGLSLNMLKATVEATIFGTTVSASESTTKVGFGGGAGVAIPAGEKFGVNAGVAYESIATEGDAFNNIVIKVGGTYMF